MSTPFADAMHEFVQASHAFAGYKWTMPDAGGEDKAAQRLAQAGDVLESALRQMIREEAPGVPFAGRARPDVRILMYEDEA